MKSIIISLLVVLLNTLQIYSQIKIEIPDNEKLLDISNSQKYITVKTKMRLINGSDNYKAVLYDKEGNKVLTHDPPKWVGVRLAKPLEKENSFIVIEAGFGDIVNGLPVSDSIFAIDISTKKIKWKNSGNAQEYVISPDNKHLIPVCPPVGPDRAFDKFSIIDLETGSKYIPIELSKYNNFNAKWLDNVHIVFATKVWKWVTDSTLFFKVKSIVDSTHNVYSELSKLKFKYDSGIIEKEQYAHLTYNLRKKINELRMKQSKIGNYNKHTRIGDKIIIYHLPTKSILMDEYLFYPNGKKLMFSEDPGHEYLHVDNENNIYLFCKDYILIKYDDNLNFLWLANYLEDLVSHTLSKIIKNESFYFKIKKKGKVYEIDKNSGELIAIDEHDSIYNFNNKGLEKGNNIVEVYNDIEINKSTNDIYLKK